MPFGWATNCLPFAFPARFAFVVAAYSAGLNALIAFSGRYLSPVFDDGFPDFVVHFWSPQSFKLFCGAFTSSYPVSYRVVLFRLHGMRLTLQRHLFCTV